MALAAALFAQRFAADWVYGDDLLTVGWLDGIGAGTLDNWGLLGAWDNQHPVGAQTALTWLVLAIVGVHFKAVVGLSLALILATAVAAWRLARSDRTGPGSDAILVLATSLVALHPNQMEHLLWAFELGWFLVNACAVWNVWLVERLGGRALPAVVALCLVATFSSAQGAFTWFAAALHLLLRGERRRRWATPAALAACGIVAILRVSARSAAIGQTTPLTADSLAGLPVFALQIAGSAFGTRNHLGLLVGGTALVGLAAALGVRVARRGGEPQRVRCSAVLIAFSLLCVVGFARGRSAFGIDWAVGWFHAAPLLVPFGLGVVLLLAAAAPGLGRGDRVATVLSASLAGLLGLGWALSAPYGLKRARLWRMDQGYAAWAACRKDVPFDTALRASGAEPYGDTLATGLPWLSPMCGSAPSPLAATLTREPALFRDLAAAHPEAGPALSVVWQDYATEPRLQLAFDPQRPDTPDRLLALAKAEASRGAPFDHVRWERFGDVLRALP